MKKNNVLHPLRIFPILCCLLICTAVYPQSSPGDNYLVIDSYPQGAQVTINDKISGVTPFKAFGLSGIDTRLKLSLNGRTRELVIGSFKGRYDVFMVMDGDYGIVNLTTTPDSMEVYADNVLIGFTPLMNHTLNPGRHELVIKRDKYETIERTIYITPTKYDLIYKAELTTSRITSKNEHITELIADDNIAEKIGESEYKLKSGYHAISLIANDFPRPIHGDFYLEGGQHYNLNARYNYFTPKYMLYSALLPGLGQFLDRSKWSGASYLTASLAGAVLYFITDNKQSQSQGEFQTAWKNYSRARNDMEALNNKAIVQNITDDINKYEKQKSLYLNITAGIYLLNVIDAIIFHSKGSEIVLNKIY